MPTRKDVKLPRWATLLLPDDGDEAPPKALVFRASKGEEEDNEDQHYVARQEEATYMRKRCFHILAHQMAQCMDQVYQQSTVSCLETLQDFLAASTPVHAEADVHRNTSSDEPLERNRQKRQKRDHSLSESYVHIEGLDSTLFDQQQELWEPQDPLLLPVFLLHCTSFSAMDRITQMEHIVHGLRADRKRSAVVLLEKRATGKKRRHCWMRQLVQALHSLLPILSASEFLRQRIVKRQKKRACNFTDLLLLWAQNVACYDDLIIVVNADDSFYTAELQKFLHILATQRAEQGIPMSVVMLAPHESRRKMELRSSLQGYAGFRVRSETLPSPDHILKQFRRSLHVDLKFPVLFPPAVFQELEKGYLQQNKCVHSVIAKYRKALALLFASDNRSLLSVSQNDTILAELWQRIAWFLLDEKARSLLLDHDTNDTNQSPCTVFNSLQDIKSRDEQAHLFLQLVDGVQHKKKHTNLHGKKHEDNELFAPLESGFLKGISVRAILEELVKLRSSLAPENDRHARMSVQQASLLLTSYVHCEPSSSSLKREAEREKMLIGKKLDLLNQLIVLVGKSRHSDDLVELEDLFKRWAFPNCWGPNNEDNTSNCSNVWLITPPRCDSPPITSDILSASEPRKQVVVALSRLPVPPRSVPQQQPSLAYLPSMMYRLIHDRVAVTQEDWYDKFWENVNGQYDCSREQSYALFSLGLRYLKQCGLVAERIRVGSRSDLVYERAKLVWCGDVE